VCLPCTPFPTLAQGRIWSVRPPNRQNPRSWSVVNRGIASQHRAYPPGVDYQIPTQQPLPAKERAVAPQSQTSCTMAGARRTSRAAAKRAQQALGKSFSFWCTHYRPTLQSLDLLVLPPLEQLQPAWPTTILQTTLRNQLPQFSWCNQALVCWQQSGPSSPRAITGQLHTSIRDGRIRRGERPLARASPFIPFRAIELDRRPLLSPTSSLALAGLLHLIYQHGSHHPKPYAETQNH
jgi:hypothetical protein